ncbi:ISH3 family transposase, partial [Halorubrum trueperi]
MKSEDQLLNFLVNRLDEEVSLNLANNVEIDAEDIYEALFGATADGTSISTLCNSSEDSPSANTILYHLQTKFEPERLERLANTLLRRDIVELLPEQVEVCADLHLRPYYGDEDDTDGLYHSEESVGPLRSTLATLYARVRNKRYTLAVRRLDDGDTASSVLAEFLGVLDGLDTEVRAVYLDRGFYDSKCLTLLQTHNYAYVVSIIRWGEAIQQELSEGWSRVIQHDLTGKLDGHSWTVEFPVNIDCTYLNGKYDDHGAARHGYAADAPFIDTPRDAREH